MASESRRATASWTRSLKFSFSGSGGWSENPYPLKSIAIARCPALASMSTKFLGIHVGKAALGPVQNCHISRQNINEWLDKNSSFLQTILFRSRPREALVPSLVHGCAESFPLFNQKDNREMLGLELGWAYKRSNVLPFSYYSV